MKTIVLADNAPTTGTTAFAGAGPVILNDTPGYYIQAVGSDPATAGTVSIDHSTDGEMWTTSATTLAVSGTTAVAAELTVHSKFMRITYSDTGATGNITVKMNISEYQV